LWRLIRVVGDGAEGQAVSSGEPEPVSPVLRILSERPWVLYVLMALLGLGSGEFTARDVAEALGLRSYVVQRALWWLKKYGFVEEVPGTAPRRYRLKSVEDPRLGEMRSFSWRCGNTTVVRIGRLYAVFINRVDTVVTRVVAEEVLECVKSVGGGERGANASEIASRCGCTVQEAIAALRALNTMMCRS